MKPLILALPVVLFASLLNLGSAQTDAGIQVVASFRGYDKRQFPKRPNLLCTTLGPPTNRGPDHMQVAENRINDFLFILKFVKDGVRPVMVPIGTPTFVIADVKTGGGDYCKYVPDTYRSVPYTKPVGTGTVVFSKHPQYAFYAKKVTDTRSEVVYAAAKAMLKTMAAVKDPKLAVKEGSIMMEIVSNSEYYVGPIDSKSIETKA